ncbi:hypothetical protein RJD24_04005 [Bacillaceae bacterium IKA-2]|nr:hypothetical protein RJD24_04005 [Bacillaceae bacterium IKA-2]
MRRETLLAALGLGAAAVSMIGPKRRKKMVRFIEPLTNIEMAEMMPSMRSIKKFRKIMMRNLF